MAVLGIQDRKIYEFGCRLFLRQWTLFETMEGMKTRNLIHRCVKSKLIWYPINSVLMASMTQMTLPAFLLSSYKYNGSYIFLTNVMHLILGKLPVF